MTGLDLARRLHVAKRVECNRIHSLILQQMNCLRTDAVQDAMATFYKLDIDIQRFGNPRLGASSQIVAKALSPATDTLRLGCVLIKSAARSRRT